MKILAKERLWTITRKHPLRDEMMRFRIEAAQVSEAKRVADELALAVRAHCGLLSNEGEQGVEVWAMQDTDCDGLVEGVQWV